MALLDRFERFLDQVIPPPDEVTVAVRRGEALLGAGDAIGAMRLSDAALSAAPGFLRASVLKADALAAMGAHREALALLDAATHARAVPAEVLGRIVELAAGVGEDWRALDVEAHARARLRGPDRALALRLLSAARTLLSQGSTASGLRIARGATMADPSLGAAWLLLGRDALTRGDHSLARRALDRAVGGIDPSDAASNRLAGEIAWGLGDRATAARCLRRAWIVGDEASVAPLVAVLSASDDPQALERVLADARGELGRVARSIVGLSRGDARAREELAGASGAALPEVLWSFALDVALREAPTLAVRWASEAPGREGSDEILKLDQAERALAQGHAQEAREALRAPLEAPRTRGRAREALRETYRSAWRGRPGTMLEELASVVRAAPEGSETLERALRLRRRELDEPLRVVLLGEFSAGKSTFLNAMVGAEVSPMGVLPTTAHVHWLRQGDRGARVVDMRGAVIESTVEEAPRVVARRRAAGEVIDYVEVTLPIARLGRLEVIDTPGFNSGDPAHEDAVRRSFDLADVGVWVFDTRQAGRHSETGPLTEARDRGLPVVGVLNKIDQAEPRERARVLSLVREGFGALAPCAMAVSARQALAASRLPPDASETERAAAGRELVESGWAEWIGYLDEHLVGQRAHWKQFRVAARTKPLVDEAWGALVRAEEKKALRARDIGALDAAIGALREALWALGSTVRKEVATALRDQLRGVEDARVSDIEALIADAVAEIGFRVRSRALATLAERMREVERLGVAVDLVPEESAPVLTAPVVQYLDHVVAEGVRDAMTRGGGADANLAAAKTISFVASDPLSVLDVAVDRIERSPGVPTDLLRIALEVAREVLGEVSAPALPVPGE